MVLKAPNVHRTFIVYIVHVCVYIYTYFEPQCKMYICMSYYTHIYIYTLCTCLHMYIVRHWLPMGATPLRKNMGPNNGGYFPSLGKKWRNWLVPIPNYKLVPNWVPSPLPKTIPVGDGTQKNHQESLASPPNTPDKLLVGTSPQIIAKDSTSYRRISWFTQIAPCFYNQFCWWYHKIHVWPDYWLHNAINIRFTD